MSEGGLRCPCVKCRCMKILSPSKVRDHLYRVGFQPNYWVWTNHGEVMPKVHSSFESDHTSQPMEYEDQFVAVNQMVYNAFRTFGNALDTNLNVSSEALNEEELPNEECQRFYNMLIDANQPIYEGCDESKLSIAIKLLRGRSNWHIPQLGIDYFSQIIMNVCPVKNVIPENYYQAEKLVSKLGLKANKIDCCRDGCMLFYKEDNNLNKCKFCHKARYLPSKTGMGNYKDIPVKRMFYLPIILRLQRLYASTATAAKMR